MAFDAKSFEAAYAAALPDHLKAINEKVNAKNAAFGLSAPTASVSVGTFCNNWPKIKGFLHTAISAVGWFLPGPAAMASAFLTAVETVIVPMVCPTPPAP